MSMNDLWDMTRNLGSLGINSVMFIVAPTATVALWRQQRRCVSALFVVWGSVAWALTIATFVVIGVQESAHGDDPTPRYRAAFAVLEPAATTAGIVTLLGLAYYSWRRRADTAKSRTLRVQPTVPDDRQ